MYSRQGFWADETEKGVSGLERRKTELLLSDIGRQPVEQLK